MFDASMFDYTVVDHPDGRAGIYSIAVRRKSNNQFVGYIWGVKKGVPAEYKAVKNAQQRIKKSLREAEMESMQASSKSSIKRVPRYHRLVRRSVGR